MVSTGMTMVSVVVVCVAGGAVGIGAGVEPEGVRAGGVVERGEGSGAVGTVLTVGDTASGLEGVEWVVGGSPVFGGGTPVAVCVVETWGGKGSRDIHRSAGLARDFSRIGLRAVAVVSGDAANTRATFDAAVKKAGLKDGVAVGWDGGGVVRRGYMEASGEESAPTVFVVDGRGVVAHVGDFGSARGVLVSMAEGRFDAEAARAERAAWEALRSRARPVERAFREAVSGRDWQGASRLAFQLVQMDAGRFGFYGVRRAGILLHELKEADNALLYAQSLVGTTLRDHPTGLAGLAELIINSSELAARGLDLALTAAVRADELTGGSDAAVAATLGRVYAERGDERRSSAAYERASRLEADPVVSARYREMARGR